MIVEACGSGTNGYASLNVFKVANAEMAACQQLRLDDTPLIKQGIRHLLPCGRTTALPKRGHRNAHFLPGSKGMGS